jgi:hypothetical protein
MRLSARQPASGQPWCGSAVVRALFTQIKAARLQLRDGYNAAYHRPSQAEQTCLVGGSTANSGWQRETFEQLALGAVNPLTILLWA